MRKISLVLVLLFSCIYNTQASEIKNYFKIGAGFSRGEVDAKSPIESFSVKDNTFPTLSIGVGQIYNNMFDYGVNFTYQDYDLNGEELKNYLVSFNLNYLITNNFIVTPYVGVGLNVNNFKSKVEGFGNDKNTELSFAYRIGLRKAINDNFDIDFNIEQSTKADAFSYSKAQNGNAISFNGEFKDTSFNLSLLYKF